MIRVKETEANDSEMKIRGTQKLKDVDMRELSLELNKIIADSRKLGYRIQIAKAAKSDAVNRFGARTADMLREIGQQRRFRVKPKGPVGSFLRLKGG